MKYYFAVAVLIGIFGAPTGAATPWERYLALPNPENAKLVSTMTYSSEFGGKSAGDDLEILTNQCLGGDAAALDLAFRLRAHADGEFLEMLNSQLALLARANPGLLLAELSRRRVGCDEFYDIVASLSVSYVDREVASGYEVARRLDALKSVKDQKLSRYLAGCTAEWFPKR